MMHHYFAVTEIGCTNLVNTISKLTTKMVVMVAGHGGITVSKLNGIIDVLLPQQLDLLLHHTYRRLILNNNTGIVGF